MVTHCYIGLHTLLPHVANSGLGLQRECGVLLLGCSLKKFPTLRLMQIAQTLLSVAFLALVACMKTDRGCLQCSVCLCAGLWQGRAC